MENKKLVNILLKDMGELEELVVEIKEKGNFDSLEIEFLHTRAKGIMQLLQMLNGNESENPVPEAIQKIVEEIPENINSEKIPPAPEIESPVKEEEIIVKPEKEEPVPEPEIKEEPQISTEEPKEEVVESKIEEPEEDISGNSRGGGEEEDSADFENGDVELEEEETTEINPRLGDSFLKGKSVNDIIHDQNKLEFKLSNRPVDSIRSAIGINDRFQYIRELFDGNPERFSETVTSIDAMKSINEAVSYLQQNFKWKKNETSLKFVNLVKRRFTNE
ncbi:hypothetical protein GM418_16190 [Maribellus comscasis]|uniref:Uncharacterized protein n=1 Tax=Maribellus comscasis TaxID=2681766 RepID=A0A6I6K566_9BACT|nr:hypothetical protein [Maribellus comscasis]QGY45154.1 hypothetical protein GM418_16190 [Maribellus comscasis]